MLAYVRISSMNTKEHVLALLEGKRGENVSGETIAGQLKISRNAVWKAVKELKKDGYSIEAVTNRGYCLVDDNDILSIQGMLPFLHTGDQAEKINVYSSLETTNKTAKEMAMSGAPHGTVVIADHQTAGLGRYGRQFFSPPGGIYMSCVLYPAELSIQTPTLVTAFAAISVCEAIETVTGKSPQIKWVNDIYLDGKKICGILTEAVTDFESGNIQWIVAGIGVNFATRDFPKELQALAGSVYGNEQTTVTRNRLAAEIINRFVRSDNNLCDEQEVIHQYKKRLFMIGKTVFVTDQEDNYEATAVDVDHIGRLIVEKKDGARRSLSAGEINIKI